MESNHHSDEATGLQPAELANAQRPHGVRVAGRARTGACGAHNPGCFRLHHDHHEAGTTGFEPATSRLTSERSAQLSYAPEQRGGRRDRLPATGDRDVAIWRLRSQLLPIGTPASACPRRHLLTGWPWRSCRSQLHVRARSAPALVPSLPWPARRRANPLMARVGFEPTISSS